MIDLSSCPIPSARGECVPEGSGSSGVMIVGEALGSKELEDGGLPFRPHAQSGALLERAIRRIGATRDMFVLYNAIPTHPPNDNLKGYESEAIEWGRPYVAAVVQRFHPRAIVAVGGIAVRATTGLSGRHLGISHLAGFVLPSRDFDIPVIPAFHPSYMRRGKIGHFGTLMRALQLSLSVAKNQTRAVVPDPDNPPSGYITHPTEQQARDYLYACKHVAEYVAYDIETYYSTNEEEADEVDSERMGVVKNQMRSIQFSAASGSGIYLPWRAPFIDIAREILALPTPKLSWNGWRFDEPVLNANGCVVNGTNHDLMWAWHHAQPDLPRGLQFAAAQFGWPYPWKHLDAANPAFYGIVDVDVLHYLAPRLFDALKRQGLFQCYTNHVVAFEQVLRRMSERGMPIDIGMYNSVRTQLKTDQQKVFNEIQNLIPSELQKVKIFKREPRVKETKAGVATFNEASGLWERKSAWKPSNKALIAYMKYHNHSVPISIKTKNETSDKDELKRLYLSTKDELYGKVLEYRAASTVLTNHMENWMPGPDGRVHPVFYFSPATGQLSSRRPNAQNAPTHGAYAKPFRQMVRAREGHHIIEFDFSGFHIQTAAFEAEDEVMSRMGQLDIHSFITAHFLKQKDAATMIAMKDDELREFLVWIKKNFKKIRDTKSKRAILGYINGLGYRKLYFTNREDFENEREAKQLVALLDHLFPKSKAYRDRIVMQAHEQGYLISRYGYIRYFFEVFKWQGGRWSHGEDHESALSYFTQNDAHGELRERMLTIDARGLSERFNLLDTIHDSILFECPDAHIDECRSVVPAILTAPSPVLINNLWPLGLSVGVDIGMGRDWAEAKGLK